MSNPSSLLTSSAIAPGQAAPSQGTKPSVVVTARPAIGVSPLNTVLTAELRGGANDFQDFYCATVEWEWGDGTKSESKTDCDPYQAGRSEITRRFVQRHTFQWSSMTPSPLSSSSPPDLSARQPESLASPLASGGDPSGGGQQPTVQFRIRFVLKQKDKVVGSGRATVEVQRGMSRGDQ